MNIIQYIIFGFRDFLIQDKNVEHHLLKQFAAKLGVKLLEQLPLQLKAPYS